MATAVSYIVLTSWALVALITTLAWFYFAVKLSPQPATVRALVSTSDGDPRES